MFYVPFLFTIWVKLMLPSIPSWKIWCVYSTAVPLSSADTVDSSDGTTGGTSNGKVSVVEVYKRQEERA